MATNKTQPTAVDPAGFVAAVEHPVRRADAETLLELMTRVDRLPATHVGTVDDRFRALPLPLRQRP